MTEMVLQGPVSSPHTRRWLLTGEALLGAACRVCGSPGPSPTEEGPAPQGHSPGCPAELQHWSPALSSSEGDTAFERTPACGHRGGRRHGCDQTEYSSTHWKLLREVPRVGPGPLLGLRIYQVSPGGCQPWAVPHGQPDGLAKRAKARCPGKPFAPALGGRGPGVGGQGVGAARAASEHGPSLTAASLSSPREANLGAE